MPQPQPCPEQPTPSMPQSPVSSIDRPIPGRLVETPAKFAAMSEGRPSLRRCTHLLHRHVRQQPQPRCQGQQPPTQPRTPSPAPSPGR